MSRPLKKWEDSSDEAGAAAWTHRVTPRQGGRSISATDPRSRQMTNTEDLLNRVWLFSVYGLKY